MDYVTVATFDMLTRAHLAIGMLNEAGIEAMLFNEHILDGAWHLGQATGGVQVQVPQADARRAHGLIQQAAFGGGAPGAEALASGDGETEHRGPAEPTPRQIADLAMAERAVRAAVFGFAFAPLQIYSLWLLFRLVTELSGDRLTTQILRRIRTAFLMDLFVIAVVIAIAFAT